MWLWTAKDEFIEFISNNQAYAIQKWMHSWTTEQKMEIGRVIREMVNEEFPGEEPVRLPMIANIVVARRP